MKTFILILFWLLTCQLDVFAGGNEVLIIQFTNQSIEKRASEIEKMFTTYKGITLFEYCPKLSSYLIEINRNQMPDDQDLLNELKQAGFDFYIKPSVNATQIRGICFENKPEQKIK